MAWKGNIPGIEGEKVLLRARELCERVGTTAQLCRIVGELLIFPYVRAEYQTARELGEEALSLAQQVGDPLLVVVDHWHLGYTLFGLGEFTEARVHFQQVISFYRPQEHHHALVSLRGSDVGVSAMAYDACCLWCLGYPEQALKRSQEALDLARELGHPFSLADVLCYAGCVFSRMRRDAQALGDHALELTRLSTELGFASFGPTGTCYLGLALTKLGKVQEGMAQIQKGIADRLPVGVRCASSDILGGLAEAQAIAGQPEVGLATLDEALAMVEETGERYAEAGLHWLRGRLLLLQGDDAEAEATQHQAERSYQYAIEVARQQDAKSWELRVTTSLARLWQSQGKIDEARQALGRIYGWFAEGFDTPDLTEARELLEKLA
jgi:adenylate cyclase